MNRLRIEHLPTGELAIQGIDTLLATCLYRIPEILRRREQPGVRDRLFPDPLSGEAEFNADWHEQLDSELHYLFVSAEKTMIRDMAALEGQTLVISAEHREAWMSALNQARLVLGQEYGLEREDLEREDLEPGDARDVAIVQVHIYGQLLHLLVEA